MFRGQDGGQVVRCGETSRGQERGLVAGKVLFLIWVVIWVIWFLKFIELLTYNSFFPQ